LAYSWPFQAQLGIERKVVAKLQEKRAEVAVHRVDIIVVHHGGGLHDPGVSSAGLRIPALLGAEHWRLLLCLADEDHPLVLAEFAQVLGHHLIFAPLRNWTSGTS